MLDLPSPVGGARISRLVFGCAPAGGSVSRHAALRAMEEAFDLGVTAFDTARSYGYGESEQILGRFAQSKRDRIAIFSKAGIRSLRPNPALRAAKGLARRVFSLAPSLRSRLRPTLGRQNQGGHFEPAELRASIDDSLRALRVERIDILFLHDVPAEIASRDDVFEELRRLQTSGKIGGSGVSGPADQLVSFLPRQDELVAWQFAAAASAQARFPPGFPPPATSEKLRLGHRVFTDAPASALASADTSLCAPLLSGICDAVVVSMYKAEHIRANVRAVSALALPASPASLRSVPTR